MLPTYRTSTSGYALRAVALFILLSGITAASLTYEEEVMRNAGHGLRLEAFKYYKTLHALPNLLRMTADQRTIMLQVDAGATVTEIPWEELEQFRYPIVQYGFRRFDGATYTMTWAARLTGRIWINYTNTYTFYVEVDDGCKLWIDGSLLLTVDGLNGSADPDHYLENGFATPKKHWGDYFLTKGLHDIQLEYFQAVGGQKLVLEYSAAGMPKKIIPKEVLFQPGSDACLAKCGDAQCRNNPADPREVECVGINEGHHLKHAYLPLDDEMEHTPAVNCRHPCANPGSSWNGFDPHDQNPATYISKTFWMEPEFVQTPEMDTDTDAEAL